MSTPPEPLGLASVMPGQPAKRSRAPWIVAGVAVVVAGGAVAALALRGGDSPTATPAAAVVAPSPTSASPSTSPTAAPSPTAAATSGKLGTVVPVSLGGDRYTVAAIKYARFDAGDGDTYGTVDARLCVDKDNGRPITVSSAPWALLYGESVMDEQITGGGLKKPEYPAGGSGYGREVKPGKCLRGWINFTLLDGKDPDAVEYSGETPDGETFTYAWTI